MGMMPLGLGSANSELERKLLKIESSVWYFTKLTLIYFYDLIIYIISI